MKNAAKLLTPEDRKRIARRIAELEARTDAEVVCAVATESGRYDRAESFCGLLVGLLAVISGNKVAAMSGWDAQDTVSVGMQVVLLVGGFLAGSLLASYWHGLRRLFVSDAEMQAEVHGKVHQVFSQQGIGGTRHRGGLLIYLSLFEHRLELRCDDAVMQRITQQDLDGIRDAVLAPVREHRLVEGLLSGLDRAGEILSEAMPATEAATEELSNQMIVFHPRP